MTEITLKAAAEKVRQTMREHSAWPDCNPYWASFDRDLNLMLSRESSRAGKAMIGRILKTEGNEDLSDE